MATYLDSTNPPTGFQMPSDPSYQGWDDAYMLQGGEANTLAGRSLDVSVEVVDIGPLVFPALTAAQWALIKAKLELKTTLYLRLPDASTVFTGYVRAWKAKPRLYGGGTIRYDLEFTFTVSLAP